MRTRLRPFIWMCCRRNLASCRPVGNQMQLPRPPFRPDIEGLRGAAILLVVLFHARVSWLAGGFVGVDVFFVLSGYFITGLLLRELDESGTLHLGEFWGRRAMRIMPPLLVVLMATLA